jgi:hypothetical protein
MNSPRPAWGFTHSDLSKGPVKVTLAAVIIILVLPVLLLLVSVSVSVLLVMAILVHVRCVGGNGVHVLGPFLDSFGGCGLGGLVIVAIAVGLLRKEGLVFRR